MSDGIKEIFAYCVLFAPAIALGAMLARPTSPAPSLTLQPERTVTLTGSSGDKMTCPAPISGHTITCVLPDGEKAICTEIDAKQLFSDCSQPWKWKWQDNLSIQQIFGADPAAVAAYEKSHPVIARSAF